MPLPSLTFNDSGDGTDSDVIATLSYSYAGQAVGSTNLYMAGTTDAQTFPFSNTENASDAARRFRLTESYFDRPDCILGMRVIKINLRLILHGVAAIIVVLAPIIVILGTIRLSKDYSIHFDFLTKWRKRADRNSFSDKNRKRYKSRKRWKNNFFKKFK